ncbi:hypothetical protein MIDIC_330002 [Alphaproteobacteria bacterium]
MRMGFALIVGAMFGPEVNKYHSYYKAVDTILDIGLGAFCGWPLFLVNAGVKLFNNYGIDCLMPEQKDSVLATYVMPIANVVTDLAMIANGLFNSKSTTDIAYKNFEKTSKIAGSLMQKVKGYITNGVDIMNNAESLSTMSKLHSAMINLNIASKAAEQTVFDIPQIISVFSRSFLTFSDIHKMMFSHMFPCLQDTNKTESNKTYELTSGNNISCNYLQELTKNNNSIKITKFIIQVNENNITKIAINSTLFNNIADLIKGKEVGNVEEIGTNVSELNQSSQIEQYHDDL